MTDKHVWTDAQTTSQFDDITVSACAPRPIIRLCMLFWGRWSC